MKWSNSTLSSQMLMAVIETKDRREKAFLFSLSTPLALDLILARVP